MIVEFSNRLFAQRLKELMTQRGMSVYELARQLQTSQPRVAQWLNAVAMPNLAAARRLAILFNVSLDYLAHVPSADR